MFIASIGQIVIARSNNCIEMENSVYFPGMDVSKNFLVETETQTRCPWRGIATYFDVSTPDDYLNDAAWSYLRPKTKARRIQGYIAFWKRVEVNKVES